MAEARAECDSVVDGADGSLGDASTLGDPDCGVHLSMTDVRFAGPPSVGVVRVGGVEGADPPEPACSRSRDCCTRCATMLDPASRVRLAVGALGANELSRNAGAGADLGTHD